MASPRPAEVLAVYGTLRRGEWNHGLLAGAEHLGDGYVSGSIHDVPRTPFRQYAYPALVTEPPGRVVVEVYRLADDDLLRRVDRLERYDPADERGSQFLRRMVDVADGPVQRAWVYLYNGPPGDLGTRLEDGDWRRYRLASTEG